MNFQTTLSIILWLCTAVHLTSSSTTPQEKQTESSLENNKPTTPHQERTKYNSACTCTATAQKRQTMPSRIPYGAPRKVLNFLRMAKRGAKFSYRRQGLMYCKNGYILTIRKDGTIGGTTQYNDGFSKVEFQSVGMSLLVIKSVATDRYLAINRHGDLYSTKVHNKESVFVERQEDNFYHSFVSHRYRETGWLIALRRNGQVKKTTLFQKATQFLILFS